MTHFNQTFITLIIDRYNLELDDYLIDSIVVTWLQKYDRDWIVKAIVESIHRGRYKVKSVDSILSGWHRVGKPAYKFTAEFEREILQSLPVTSELNEDKTIQIQPSQTPELPVTSPTLYNFNSDDLNPEESAPFQHHNYSSSNIVSQSLPLVGNEEDRSSVILKSTSLTSLQHRLYDIAAVDERVEQTEVIADRTISYPANLQLFKTLTAIVEPKNRKIPNPIELDPSPSYLDAAM